MEKILRRDFLKTIGLCLTALSLPRCTSRLPSENRPNFVFFLIDDMGWKDAGCYGSTYYETPHIDKLARQGMRFTDAYAACPVCSPTRASIMTGKYPARINITDWITGDDPQNRILLGSEDFHQLPLEEVTIAEALEQAGYKTGFLGKWHLGGRGFYPEDQGFQFNKGGHWAGHPASYFYPYKNDRKRWDVPGLEGGEEGEYLTDRLTDESLTFIEKNQRNPFLLFLSHYAVHTPIQSKEDLTEKYRKKLEDQPPPGGPDFIPEGTSKSKQKQDRPAYAGMVESVDQSVGRIMNKLDKLGLSENTIIIFMSDNGGLSTSKWNTPTSNVPLRAGKGWLYEGGIREPMIIKWPGIVNPESICSVPVTSTDFYPTMLEMAGLNLQPDQHQDGESLIPLLQGGDKLNRTSLFWHYPHYHSSGQTPAGAMRDGDYKFIEWYEDGRVELFNLSDDLEEKRNLAHVQPEKTEEMRKQFHSWREDVGALMPRTNPAWQE